LDPTNRRDQEGFEERGNKFLKKVEEIKKQDAVVRAKEAGVLNQQVVDQERIIHQQKLEIDELRTHLQTAMKDLAAKDDQLRKLEDKSLRINEECQKYSKELKALAEKNDQLKNVNMETKRMIGGLEKQKQGVEREQSQMTKNNKKYEAELAKKEQR
jgi:chromosome segregation ATPase